jgi:hypothetical protein
MKKHSEIGGWLLVMAYAFFLIALFAALSLVPKTAKGAELRPNVDAFSLDLKRLPFQRDYFFPEQSYWGHELQLNWDVSVGRVFMLNHIVSRTYGDRFRYVAWKYDLGYAVTDYLDVLWSHHSQHALDAYREAYPITDSYGIRLHFIKRGDK